VKLNFSVYIIKIHQANTKIVKKAVLVLQDV